AKQAPHRPGTAKALGLRAGLVAVAIVEQTTLVKEIPMWFRSLFDALSARSPRTPARRGRHAPARRSWPAPFRPRLEGLEERWVPSTLTVTNALDTGVAGDGSLRGEIAAAQSGDVINFAPGLAGQTITLTNGELAITRSLDIEGPGA